VNAFAWSKPCFVLSWVRPLTLRWSGRVRNKVPSSYVGVRAAQLNR